MERLFLILELAGTLAFAASGAITGLKKNMDIFGVCILALTTAVGGGVIRDLILGRTPPATFQTPIYAAVAAVTALGSGEGAFDLMKSPIPTALTSWNLGQLSNGQPLILEDGGWTMTACLTWEGCSVTAIGMVVLEEDAEEGTCQFTLRLEKIA